jgi:uncharacterized damage-inducible protein DinB
MTFEDLNTMLDYHYWARDRVLTAVEPLTAEQFTRAMGNSFSSVRDTLAHIVSAEIIWLARWRGASPKALLPADRHTSLADVQAEWTRLEPEVREFLRALGPDGITRVFEYKLISGQPGSSPFWQMLQHVVNHATYHRGQVTTMLRQLGAQPGKSMDMIAFYRERG